MRVDATHAEETMPTGMVRRNGRYCLRRRVPLDLIEVYGTREITKAHGTSDFAEAKKLHAREWVRLDDEFDAKRATLNETMAGQKGQPVATETDPERPVARRKTTMVDVLLAMKANLDLLPTSPEVTPVLARASNDGKTSRSASSPSNPPKALTWDRLVEKWAAERKPASKTRQAHASVAEQFRSLVGTLPEDVSREDVIAFKDRLVEGGVTAANLRTKLSRLKTVINYGHENGLVKQRAADGVRAPKSKVKARVPFDDVALKQVFSGPVHKDGLRPLQGRGEAAFWLPLIALYTGARLEEIAWLRVDDLIELGFDGEDGSQQMAWFFRFYPDPAENRTLKNDNSERSVPVHPELIRLGLLRYADALRNDGEFQLFPRLTAHASGKRAHKWGQWFGSYLRGEGGVSDTRKVFHSFRHTLKDACRESGVTEELQRAIMGHDATGVAGSYGLGFSRRRIVEGMNCVRVQGLPDIKPAA